MEKVAEVQASNKKPEHQYSNDEELDWVQSQGGCGIELSEIGRLCVHRFDIINSELIMNSI